MITEEKVLCKRCNRVLTDDVSIDRGYGPVCWLRVQEEKQEELLDGNTTIDEVV